MNLRSLFGSGSRSLVGVDIGASAVKVAQLRAAGRNKYRLESVASEPLPADSIVDGAVISKLAVADAIEKAFKQAQIKDDRVATSICGHSVIVKKVSVPAQSEKELDGSIRWEAEQYIPFDISEVNLDYQILGKADQGNRLNVLLVAAKRDKISDHTSVVSMAGKHPVVVDIDSFALQNAYEASYTPDSQQVTALLDVGATMINVTIVRGAEFLFARDIAMGGHQYTEYLQKELNISFEEAESFKAGGAPNEELKARTDAILEVVTENATLEIQKTFDFFRTTTESLEIGQIYLSGGASRTRGFKSHLEEKLKIPIEYLDPFKGLDFDQKKVRKPFADEMSSDFAIAVGLALRAEGDR